MNKHILWKLSALAAVLALTLTLGLAAVTGLSTAQAANATNGTIEIGSDEPESVEHTVGALEVLSTELRDDGVVVLEVRATEATSYKLTDSYAGYDKKGWSDVPETSDVIRSGRHTIRLDVTVIEESAMVTLSTPEDTVRWNAEALETGRPPVSYQQAQIMVALAATGAAAFTFRTVRRRREDEKKEWERIL